MAFKLARCPSCGGDLNITTDKDFLFCPFCGAKIIRDDTRIVIEHINRTVDETKLKELEREEDRDSASNRKHRIMGIGWFVIAGILAVLAFICWLKKEEIGIFAAGIWALLVFVFGLEEYSEGAGKKKK